MRIIALIALAGTLAVTVAAAGSSSSPGRAHAVASTYQGKTVLWWAARAVAARRDANVRRLELRNARAHWVADARALDEVRGELELTRARLGQRQAVEENEYEHAAKLAAAVLGVDSYTLIRKGRCESVNWTQFHNASGASGPWQFLLSTWKTTPLAAFSRYDPLAAALAAAWMHAEGRGGEWVCR